LTENKHIITRIRGKLASIFARVYNMHTHKAEQYYFRQYFAAIEPYLNEGMKVCDIGCQYGRFTIPMAEKGMLVTATDIRAKFFKYIAAHTASAGNIAFRNESITRTIELLKGEGFDAVLCLELIYNLRDPESLLKGMKTITAENGLVIVSHRSKGYYLYRFLRKKKFTEAQAIMNNLHEGYNAQDTEELKQMYRQAGLKIVSLHGIGLFSGYGDDPFACTCNPSSMTIQQMEVLNVLEQDEKLQSLFINNSRYILVIARCI